MTNKWLAVGVSLCLGLISTVSAKTIESFPEAPPTRVMDYTKTFDATQTTALETSLNKLKEAATPTESFLVVVDSLEDQNIEEYTNQLFRKWKLGNKETNNGLLMVVAKSDRKYRTEVGYGLEGVLPDGAVGRLMRDTLKPYFKKGQFFEGLSQYINDLDIKLNKNTALAEPTKSEKIPDFIIIMSSMGLFILFAIIGFSMVEAKAERRRQERINKLREADRREQEVSMNRQRIRDSLMAGAAGYAAGSALSNTPSKTSSTPKKSVKSNDSTSRSSDDSYSGFAGSSFSSSSDSSSSSSFDSGGDSGGGGSSGDW